MDVLDFASPSNPLREVHGTRPARYLLRYLALMGARGVLVERRYPDLEFREDDRAFRRRIGRAVSADRTCRRVHLFSLPGVAIARALAEALRGTPAAEAELSAGYLGFIVLRPTPGAPFGRSVLAKWPRHPNRRVGHPAREYRVSMGGITLRVQGLAWQQQHPHVSCCGTVALWTALQCFGTSERYRVPSGAELTDLARTLERRRRIRRPRHAPQVVIRRSIVPDLIAAQRLEPMMFVPRTSSPRSRVATPAERFKFAFSALVRSGFATLLFGRHEDARPGGVGHALCGVGFCSPPSPVPAAGIAVARDADLKWIYAHDDSVGPAVRFRIDGDGPADPANRRAASWATRLVADAPDILDPLRDAAERGLGAKLPADSAPDRGDFVLEDFIAPVDADVLLHVDPLRSAAAFFGDRAATRLRAAGRPDLGQGVVYAARYWRASAYLRDGILRQSSAPLSPILGERLLRARRQALDRVVPRTAIIAVVRIRTADAAGPYLLGDLLFDASEPNPRDGVLAWIPFDAVARDWGLEFRPKPGVPVIDDHLAP
jgi:hypothetical protein